MSDYQMFKIEELEEEIKTLKEKLIYEFNRGVTSEKERIKKEVEKLKRHDVELYAFVSTLIK